eukprot:Phypoly_transcript_06116.p1 GENE.Phypoly_transcript_06116~~Phypoly_transcript_06116.p1  ORF type:complete len:599 (+),score=94.24 Phypoly_transcript_06116:252-1799(+)
MEPILKDIETRVASFPPSTKEMVDKALDLLLKDFQAALDFISRQNKKGAIKKFVIAKTTEEEFQELSSHIKSSRDIFMFAIVNKIDSASAPPPSPPSNGRSKTGTEMEVLRKAFNEKKYEEAVKIGKELLRTVPPQSEMCYVIYLSMACSYACLNHCEDAMMYIHCAKENGWDNVQYLECEDLSNLRELPEFLTFKEKMSQELYKKERWRTLPQEQVDQLTRNFERYDIDGSGTISATEFRVLMKRNSSELSDEAIQKLFAEISEKTGQIELNRYLNYLADNSNQIPRFLIQQSSVEDIAMHLQDFSLSKNSSELLYSNPSPPPSLSHELSFCQPSPQWSDFAFSSSSSSISYTPPTPDAPSFNPEHQYTPHTYHSLPPVYGQDLHTVPYHSLPTYAPSQTQDFIHTHRPYTEAHHSLPVYTSLQASDSPHVHTETYRHESLHEQDNLHTQDNLHILDNFHLHNQSTAVYQSLPVYSSPQHNFHPAQPPPAYYSTNSYYPPAIHSQPYAQNTYYQ